jgi:hypothetical protein
LEFPLHGLNGGTLSNLPGPNVPGSSVTGPHANISLFGIDGIIA